MYIFTKKENDLCIGYILFYMSGFMARGTNMILHSFHRRNSGSVGIYGKRGIKTNVTFSEGSPPELCVIVPIDKRG